MAFTDHEKARVRHFLGYPSFSQLSQSIQLGYPAASEPLFLLDDAFRRLVPEGEEVVRRDLCECEDIEKQLGGARSRLKAQNVGDIRMNGQETSNLRQELQFWSQRLADDLGVVRNPYSQMAHNGMPGGLNASVSG